MNQPTSLLLQFFVVLLVVRNCYPVDDELTAHIGRELQFFSTGDIVDYVSDSVSNLGDSANDVLSDTCGYTGWRGNKWTVMDQKEADNCAWATPDKLATCQTVWGKQTGGDEVLDMAIDAALACAYCNAGCAACAASQMVDSVVNEIMISVNTMVDKIIESLRVEGSDFAEEVLDDLYGVLLDTVWEAAEKFLSGDLDTDFWEFECLPYDAIQFGMRMGVAYYGGENCVCNSCVPALNAMRPWISWFIRIRRSDC
eukprot:TRINITY_DN6768_c0_g2_i9.p1 TRINITY_DN6768_c0_g2~~TRINITY_DN6768_c0_g2_i9.p1  ORF type:complete len:255 (-),score=43.71 TRINITY_DN6768_c0_g2_i9:674-1438(-)